MTCNRMGSIEYHKQIIHDSSQIVGNKYSKVNIIETLKNIDKNSYWICRLWIEEDKQFKYFASSLFKLSQCYCISGTLLMYSYSGIFNFLEKAQGEKWTLVACVECVQEHQSHCTQMLPRMSSIHDLQQVD